MTPSWKVVRRLAVALTALVCLVPDIARADDVSDLSTKIDMVWVVVAAALVFLMQGGFLVFELGLVRGKNTAIVALKNIGDWAVVSLAFYAVGFGLMFGHTAGGFIGTDLLALVNLDTVQAGDGGATHLGWAFVVFQLAFCGTAATIVSGAMAERTGFKAYIGFAVFMGAIVFPVFGHWAWGSLFLGAGNEGWLESMGFHDFAGSAVVHGVGAWASLVGVWIVGPRLGRYRSDGSVNRMEGNSLAWSAFGTAILWFGWWGFNGGSTLEASADVPRIIFVTNLAAVSAGLSGFVHAVARQGRRNVEEKLLGAMLGGLVAITACCDVMSAPAAIVVGLVAGVVHNIGFELVLNRWRLDDVVGAVPVHGFCGVWGCLAVALLGEVAEGTDRFYLLGVQALGVLVCFAWTTSTSLVAFVALRRMVGIRIDPIREIEGISLSAETGPTDVEELDTDEIQTDDLDDMSQFMDDIRSHIRTGERLDVY